MHLKELINCNVVITIRIFRSYIIINKIDHKIIEIFAFSHRNLINFLFCLLVTRLIYIYI